MRDDEILKVHQELLKLPNLDDVMRKGIDFEIEKLRGINAIKNPESSQIIMEMMKAERVKNKGREEKH